MFIRSLKLRNILSFREPPPLELRPLNILIGPNGSGKSNLINCIGLLPALPNLVSFINGTGGSEGWLWKGHRGSKGAAGIACQFDLGQESLEYSLSFSAVERALAIQDESLVAKNDHTYVERTGGMLKFYGGAPGLPSMTTIIGPAESSLAAYRNPADTTPVTLTARTFDNIRIYSGFQTGPFSSARLGVESSAPKHPLNESGANLALVLQEMDFRGSLKRVVEYLNRLSDRFEEIKINLEGGRAQVYVRERRLGLVSATRLSDGTLKFLCLMAVLFDPNPGPLVCIDEPEAGLHPDAITLVGDVLREASTRMQLIVTTHSDALVDRFTGDPESVVVCERDFDESTCFRRLSRDQLKEWLEEYTLGDLWHRGEIGGMQR